MWKIHCCVESESLVCELWTEMDFTIFGSAEDEDWKTEFITIKIPGYISCSEDYKFKS